MAPSPPAGRKPNHLAGETSPYLLQHLYNPVDWHPWGPEAHERARHEDRPIFLSIGYAACHWCHVMEHESFEDPEIASYLNRFFIPVKVDREERPDLDEIYMNAVQLMTGQGGWPLSVFLTPDLEPFMGGTYFPPEARHGRIGFPELLQTIHEAWSDRRDEIDNSAGELTTHLRRIAAGPAGQAGNATLGRRELAHAAAELTGRFDAQWGGFGAAPKFPPDGGLALLLHLHACTGEAVPLQMATTTLDRMALGGMYDQIGGGFARYSVDPKWLVPHFEKMLYNQALLAGPYLDAWLITGKPLYRRVVEETLEFVRREMTSDEGGFYSSLDADSEGQEGSFYVWNPDEIVETLGREDGRFVCEIYDINPGGNFEGKSIPNLLGGPLEVRAESSGLNEQGLVARLGPLRNKLLAARERRVRPGTDDKILTAWNGLMISAFARSYQVIGRESDLHSAVAASEFLLARSMKEGRLSASYREGLARVNGFLDDYAFLARGLLDLYEAAFDRRFLEYAGELARSLVAHFEDREQGGFFFTSDDHESLLTRNRSLTDGALPAGAGVAVELLARLALHLNEPDFRRAAERTLVAYRPAACRMPSAHASLLMGAEWLESPPPEVAILGSLGEPRTRELLASVRRVYRYRPVVQLAGPGTDPGALSLLAGKRRIDDRPTAYVCRDYACQSPTSDPAELARQLGDG